MNSIELIQGRIRREIPKTNETQSLNHDKVSLCNDQKTKKERKKRSTFRSGLPESITEQRCREKQCATASEERAQQRKAKSGRRNESSVKTQQQLRSNVRLNGGALPLHARKRPGQPTKTTTTTTTTRTTRKIKKKERISEREENGNNKNKVIN